MYTSSSLPTHAVHKYLLACFCFRCGPKRTAAGHILRSVTGLSGVSGRGSDHGATTSDAARSPAAAWLPSAEEILAARSFPPRSSRHTRNQWTRRRRRSSTEACARRPQESRMVPESVSLICASTLSGLVMCCRWDVRARVCRCARARVFYCMRYDQMT